LDVGLLPYLVKKKIVEKPKKKGGQGLNWAVEPRRENSVDTATACPPKTGLEPYYYTSRPQ
jgi:hypothetical protein